jgi:pyruvate formate lyase activating enzyme
MNSVQIKGLQKTSLIDFQPYTSCVVFLAGCNFRCGFCQNPNLIVEIDKTPTISQDEFFGFLEKRKKWLDGVVITGGEPSLYDDLPEFIRKIKDLGYKVKFDSNGTNPKMIKELIGDKLIDYVAMDIKGSLEKYDKVAGIDADKDKIRESADLIMKSGVDYEFRLTAVPSLLDKEDVERIGVWLKGAKKFYIQQFRNKICLDRSFEKIKPFAKEKLDEFRGILKGYIDNVEIR